MKFISPLLKRVVYPCLAGAGYFRSVKRSGLAVVTYHGVVAADYKPIDPALDGSLVTTEKFRRQLRLLKSNYNVIPPEQMLSWCLGKCELPPRAVLISCDDGLQNNVTEMLPILEAEGLRCLFFVTGASAADAPDMFWYEELFLLLLQAPAGKFQVSAGDIELRGDLGSRKHRRNLWWRMVNDLSRVDANSRELFLQRAYSHFGLERSREYCDRAFPSARHRLRLLNPAELQKLAAAGMTIGAHTCTHPILAQQPPDLAWREITESRTRLESVLNRKIWAFAYPFGFGDTVSSSVMSMVQEADFTAAFLNIDGGLGAELPIYAIPRVHVNADMGLSEFDAHVSGFYRVLQQKFRHEAAKPVPFDSDSRAMSAHAQVSKEKTA